MAKAQRRTPVPGPAFIRLLARVTDVDVPPSSPMLSERLGQWIDWTRAVALSRALDGRSTDLADGTAPNGSEEADACVRMRASLVDTISGDRGPVGIGQGEAGATIDYAVFRQHYLAQQRSMLAVTGQLRGRLRDRLASTSTDLARLAGVDAVMEQTLAPREQALLASVPVLLGEHFERLRQADAGALADAEGSADLPSSPTREWLDVFRRDMQAVLLAELDVRFQPIDALLAALRTS